MNVEDFYKEKRKFVRYGLEAHGELCFDDGKIYKGAFLDISVAGTFLETEGIDPESINQFVDIVIITKIKGELNIMKAQCKIARVTDNGVGLLFGKMDELSKNTFHAVMQELRDNLIKD